MILKEYIPLAEYTTFKIGGPARFLAHALTEEGLVKAVRMAHEKGLPIFVLGGGSNILVSDNGFSGVVIKMEMRGISFKRSEIKDKKSKNQSKNLAHEGNRKESREFIVSAAAGEMWDDLVEKTVNRGLYGLANLSAIPGTVGAAPIQNIGAYGAEVSQTIFSVRALDTVAMKFVDLTNAQCRFDYRDSIFKRVKGRYIVTRVDFRLFKNGRVNISYKDLADYFAAKHVSNPTLKQVRDAVIEVRWGKLPDWKLWGTAGSYFKNPIIPLQQFIELKVKYPDLPGFPEPDGCIKVSLGWILDRVCRVKGLAVGNVSTYEKQALVVVAKPGATAAEVVGLTHELMKRVKDATGIEIAAEVEWVN